MGCGRLVLSSGKAGVLAMLMGEYQHNIDAKGRLIVPSKFREELGEKFVVTRGMDGCLFGYPLNEWSQLEAKLQEMPLAKKDARTFVRFFYSAATECEIDKQGRINIPANLRTHASLEKAVLLSASLTELKFGVTNVGMHSLMKLKKTLMN